MNEILGKIPADLRKELETIRCNEDIKKLRAALSQALSVTVRQIIVLAAIVRRLEELGDDLSDLDITILPQIRKVAYGQIIPEILVVFQGRPQLLRRVAALPIPDQRRMAAGEGLKVFEPGGDHRLIPPGKLTPTEINQVFASDRVRDDAEQAAWLRDRARENRAKPQADPLEVCLDLKRGGIFVGPRFISASDLAHYLSQLTTQRKGRLKVPS